MTDKAKDKNPFGVIDCTKLMKENAEMSKAARVNAFKQISDLLNEMTEAGIPRAHQMEIMTAMFKAVTPDPNEKKR